MVDAALISHVKSLSAAERLELMSAVWETLAPDDIPVTEDEATLLDARLADAERHPQDQSPWLEVRERLGSQLL